MDSSGLSYMTEDPDGHEKSIQIDFLIPNSQIPLPVTLSIGVHPLALLSPTSSQLICHDRSSNLGTYRCKQCALIVSWEAFQQPYKVPREMVVSLTNTS